MTSEECDSFGGTGFRTLGFCISPAAVEEGSGSCAGSGARGPSEGPGSVAEVVVEAGVAATGGGGCEEGPGVASVGSVGLF